MSVSDETRRLVRLMQLELDDTVDATLRALAGAWSRAWEEVVAEWAAAVEELASAGEWPSPRQVQRLARARRALEVTADAVERLAAEQGVRITRLLPDLTAAAERWQRAIVASQLPADQPMPWTRVDTDALGAIVERTTGQIESLLQPLPADQQSVMRQVLIRGVAVGESPREAAREMLRRLGGAFDGGRRRAETIARTEMLDAHRAAAQASRIENADVLGGWRWSCSLSARTCPACLSMHGRRFPVGTPGPQGHPNCRCAAMPVTKTWRDLGFDIDEPADDFPDARTWFDQQPTNVQTQIMGAERLARLRSGDLDWDRLAVRRPNPDWRPSYAVRPLARQR